MLNKKRMQNEKEDRCNVRMVHLDRISRAKSEAVPDKELEHLAMTYKILGDPTRLKIVLALRNQEMCVCDLAAFTGLTESAVSHQLRHMRTLALVKKRRERQILYYSLNDRHVTELLEISLEHAREQH